MPNNLVRNFSKMYMSHKSLQNWRKTKKQKRIWTICAGRAAGKILFSGATVRMKNFATEVSLQGFCWEWVLKFKQTRNTENTMKCSAERVLSCCSNYLAYIHHHLQVSTCRSVFFFTTISDFFLCTIIFLNLYSWVGIIKYSMSNFSC